MYPDCHVYYSKGSGFLRGLFSPFLIIAIKEKNIIQVSI